MTSPSHFYTVQLNKFKKQLIKINTQLTQVGVLRLFVFAGILTTLYFLHNKWVILFPFLLISIICFLFLVVKHSKLKYKKQLTIQLIKINQEELKIFKGSFLHRESGAAFIELQHEYSGDVDLFGKGSFYQYMNRTTLIDGAFFLSKLLTENTITCIVKKQNAIKELSEKPEWRQLFSAHAQLIKPETSIHSILKWVAAYKDFVPPFFRFIPFIFGLISICIIVATIISILPISILIYWLIIGLCISAIYFKKINALSNNITTAKDTLKQYGILIHLIENESFKAKILQEKKQIIITNNQKATVALAQLTKILDALDQRNNILFGFLGNGFLLWDLYQCYRIEKWLYLNKNHLKYWLDTVYFFDAYNSLGNYCYNHPKHTFPILNKENSIVIKASKLGHPLLPEQKRICNDFLINTYEFKIITGANMAGKSTFLRTVSLFIIMANAGLPVCAETSYYTPIKLITSMRALDSLVDDTSYFFSELTRLKQITEAIKKDPHFIILDEILKGTNNIDKVFGSKKFLEKLINNHATGIIATHDTSLCELEQSIKQISNFYFDAEIKNNKLYFDFTLKQGVCQNMNASFLLKKMGIV